jgi:excinuclease ABC subunit A
VDEICDHVLALPEGSKILVNAPVVRGRKGEYVKELNGFKKSGFGRVKIDGIVYDLQEEIHLEKNIKHNISVVVDRLIIKPNVQKRLTDSLETALKLADGLVVIDCGGEETLYSVNYACPDCGVSLEEIEPRMFSFNTVYGACPTCSGLGFKHFVDPDLICPDKTKTLREGAMKVTGWNLGSSSMALMELSALAKAYDFSLDVPVQDLPPEIYDILMYGSDKRVDMRYETRSFSGSFKKTWEGYVNNLQRRYGTSTSDGVKSDIEKLMRNAPCDGCNGQRLKKEALAVTVGGKNIWEVCETSIDGILDFLDEVSKGFTKTEHLIADAILKEINNRLGFLRNVGLNYLTLSRSASTLSGGESQRIRLATQIGSALSGVLYILASRASGCTNGTTKSC